MSHDYDNDGWNDNPESEPQWDKALKYVQDELRKARARGFDGKHPSFASLKILRAAEEKFDLPTHGVEGFTDTVGNRGVSYLNTGDPYGFTIVVQESRHDARASLGNWGDLAESGYWQRSDFNDNPSSGIYATTYCNKGHYVRSGRPVRHECITIPPAALRAEMEGDIDRAIEIMQAARRKGR